MKFFLFGNSNQSFKVRNPADLIEAFCFQNDFYSSFDIIPVENKEIEHVNRIGARIRCDLLSRCKNVVDATKKLKLFRLFGSIERLDGFLRLSTEERHECIEEFNERAVKKLLEIDGIGLSKATKVFHTFYPDIVPIIDNPLQELYKKEINQKWKMGESKILSDFYDNLKYTTNLQNLNRVSAEISKRKIHLTKVRVFDVLWWSLLKAKKLREEHKEINLRTISWYIDARQARATLLEREQKLKEIIR